jgi:transcriptional regulator with XRE-family HTH domain
MPAESTSPKAGDVQSLRPNGAAMRALRTALKVSLRDIQARTGLDRGHLSRLERGLAGASPDTIRRYANALKVSTAAITHDR